MENFYLLIKHLAYRIWKLRVYSRGLFFNILWYHYIKKAMYYDAIASGSPAHTEISLDQSQFIKHTWGEAD